MTAYYFENYKRHHVNQGHFRKSGEGSANSIKTTTISVSEKKATHNFFTGRSISTTFNA